MTLDPNCSSFNFVYLNGTSQLKINIKLYKDPLDICIQSWDGSIQRYQEWEWTHTLTITSFSLPGPIIFLNSFNLLAYYSSDRYIRCIHVDEIPQKSTSRQIKYDWEWSIGENVFDLCCLNHSMIYIIEWKKLTLLSERGECIHRIPFHSTPSAAFLYEIESGNQLVLIT